MRPSSSIRNLNAGQKFKSTPCGRIPLDWGCVRLQQICRLEYGSNLIGQHRSGAGFPVYGSNGVVGFHKNALVQGPGIVIGRKGAIGEVIWSDSDFWPIDTTYYVVPNDALCDLRWLYYLLSQCRLERLNQASGVPGLNRSDVYELPIALPPLEEQKKIAEILTSVDEAIEATRKVVEQTRQTKASLIQELLTKGLPNQHTRFRNDKRFGRIPASWETVQYGTLLDQLTSGSRGWAQYYSDYGALFIRITNLTRQHVELDLTDCQYVNPPSSAEGKRTLVKPGDILVSITADLGIIGLVPENIGEAYVNQHIALTRLRDSAANPCWVALFFASNYGQSQFHRLCDSGAKAGLNLSSVQGLYIALPKPEEQNRICETVQSLAARIAGEQAKMKQLYELKASLLQTLLTGQKRVKV